MKTYPALLIILLVFVFSSCEGPEGAVGPQGAPGAQGPAGQTGPAGKVTFYSTGWVKADNNHWVQGYDAASLTANIFIQNGAISNITQADLNGGIILVYDTHYEDKAFINALPYDMGFEDNHVWFSYGASRLEGKNYIDLYATFTKNINPQKFFTETIENVWYRVIIIPASAGGRLKGVDLRDYHAVKEFLELKD